MRVLLSNFHNSAAPEGVDEVLLLLGLWRHWDSSTRTHHIYHRGATDETDVWNPEKAYTWIRQDFAGGDKQAWAEFLQEITAMIREQERP